MTAAAAERLSILLLDDNATLGPSLGRWFDRSNSFHWAGSVEAPEGISGLIGRTHADVVLVDWHIPGVQTPQLVERLVRDHPGVKFVMLSEYLIASQIRRCLEAGAAGYLYKGQSPAELAAEIRCAADGDVVLSPEVQAELEADERKGP